MDRQTLASGLSKRALLLYQNSQVMVMTAEVHLALVTHLTLCLVLSVHSLV